MSQNDSANELARVMEKMDRDFAERQKLILGKCNEDAKIFDKYNADLDKQKKFRFAPRLKTFEIAEETFTREDIQKYVKKYGVGYESFKKCLIPLDWEKYYATENEMKGNIVKIYTWLLDAISLKFPGAFVGQAESCGQDLSYNEKREAKNKEEGSGFKCGPWKLSLHFVIDNGTYYNCGFDFLSNERVWIEEHGFDTSIYKDAPNRQLFRVLGASKELNVDKYGPGDKHQNRPLRRSFLKDGKMETLTLEDCLNIQKSDPERAKRDRLDWMMLIGDIPDWNKPVPRNEIKNEYQTCGERTRKTTIHFKEDTVRKILFLLGKEWYTDRDKWLKIGWSLRSTELEYGIPCFDMWHEWSQQGSSYQQKSCTKCYYESPKKDKAARTLGTIMKAAKECNKSEYSKIISEATFMANKKKILEDKNVPEAKEDEFKFREYDDWNKMRGKYVTIEIVKKWTDACIVQISNGGRYVYMSKVLDEDVSANQHMFTWQQIEIEKKHHYNVEVYCDIEKDGEPRLATSFQEILDYMNYKGMFIRKKKVEFMPYLNIANPRTSTMHNSFTGYASHLPENGNINDPNLPAFESTMVYKHILLEICDSHKASFHYVMNFIAHLIQCPAINPRAAMIWYSMCGCGKDLITDFIGYMVGYLYTVKYQSKEEYLEKHNIDRADKLINVVNELKDHSKKDDGSENIMKGRLDAKKDHANQKNKDIRQFIVLARLFFFSNNKVPMKIDGDDRRYMAVRCANIFTGPDYVDYYKKLAAEIDSKEVRLAGFKYFSSMDISNFDTRPPITEYKSELAVNSTAKELLFLIHFVKDIDNVDEYPAPHVPERGYRIWTGNEFTIRTVDMYLLYKQYASGPYGGFEAMKASGFEDQLRRIKMEVGRPYVNISGNKTRINGYVGSREKMQDAFRKHYANQKFDIMHQGEKIEKVPEDYFTDNEIKMMTDGKVIELEVRKIVSDMIANVIKTCGESKVTIREEDIIREDNIITKKCRPWEKDYKPVSDDTMALMAGY